MSSIEDEICDILEFDVLPGEPYYIEEHTGRIYTIGMFDGEPKYKKRNAKWWQKKIYISSEFWKEVKMKIGLNRSDLFNDSLVKEKLRNYKLKLLINEDRR